MALMTWHEDYSVKIPQFDAQHRHLFFLLNVLNDAMNTGKGNEILEQILEELVQYTSHHFHAEEELMVKKRFPGLAAHMKEHDALRARVLKFQRDFSKGKVAVSIELLNFLRASGSCSTLPRPIASTARSCANSSG